MLVDKIQKAGNKEKMQKLHPYTAKVANEQMFKNKSVELLIYFFRPLQLKSQY